jgi:hypothetical protein
MNCYEIQYKQDDMPKDFIARTDKWARDEKQAISFVCKAQPKDGRCTGKRGGALTIISVTKVI